MASKRSNKLLPKVGEVLYKIPNECARILVMGPAKCIVTYVHHSHNWYEVNFVDFNFKECYKDN